MSRKINVLVAEDEAPLRSLLQVSLEAAGYRVRAAEDGERALELFQQGPFDLVILDVMMPKVDGFTVCKEIRKRSDVPVVMLTALGSVDDIVKGFELGADDYITKPFTFKEVEARIEAILRRIEWSTQPPEPDVISIGRVKLDADAHQVEVDGKPVHLTPIEFQLLRYLMIRAGKPVSKDMLFREVWGYDFAGGTNLVEVAVRRLREKIEENPSAPTHIITVRGAGYKFREPEEPKAQVQR
ncbi:MAG TPA: response regulator transcription factor [Anaerolineae bacterium]|nr:response regulator transcription factor [Anaerolineae bacterium]HIQ05132.1 response regulator transcription factor [Anaerolineae bacterium]